MNKNKIKNLIVVGDEVFDSKSGRSMIITAINSISFKTKEGVFLFSEHGKRYFLTQRGFEQACLKGKGI